MNESDKTIEELATLTGELEQNIPSIKGAFPNFEQIVNDLKAKSSHHSVHIFGTIKSGKSTLANALIEQDILPRGSGVKTFNVTRVTRGDHRKVVISFKTEDQLRQQLSFDFKLLGLDLVPPGKIFHSNEIQSLSKEFEEQIQELKQEKRITSGTHHGLSLAQLSMGRIERVLEGLMLVGEGNLPFKARIDIESDLVFEGDEFDSWYQWSSSPALAALIRDIRLALPEWSAEHRYELVDCQGSDSLNPLDRHAIDTNLHSVGTVLYVVSSRVGLRSADCAILEKLQESKNTENVVFIQNVESHEPLPRDELNKLELNLKRDLEFFAKENLVVHQVNAYRELMTSVDPAEATRVRDLWEKRGCLDTLELTRKSYEELQVRINQKPQLSKKSPTILATEARAIAEKLLLRDIDILGVRGSASTHEEVVNAIKSVVDGERERLETELFSLTYKTFESGGLPSAIKRNVAQKPKEWLRHHGLPETLGDCQHHGPIIATAIESFNSEWLKTEELIRSEFLTPYLEEATNLILDRIEMLHRLLPTIIPEEVLSRYEAKLPKSSDLREMFSSKLQQAKANLPFPVVLGPVALKDTVVSALAAEFYARKYMAILMKKLTKKEPSPQQVKLKAQKLWQRSIERAFAQSIEDTSFGVSSARENFKFLYFRKLTQNIMQQFEQVVLELIHAWYEDLRTEAESGRLLLTGQQRQRLEAFIENVSHRAI